jgi:hypothetical protein
MHVYDERCGTFRYAHVHVVACTLDDAFAF